MNTMTTTDFRALCAELYQEFSSLYCDMSACVDFNDSYMERIDNLCNRADAALATVPTELPTDKELLMLGNDLMGDCLLCEPDLLLNFARAALERWGR